MLRQLRYRHKLVKLRTMVVNSLHALAINAGLSLRAKLLTRDGRQQLRGLSLSAISHQQRDELVSLADELTRRIGNSGAVAASDKLSKMCACSGCRRILGWGC